jgi:predicted ribosome quality control (RQC) complex YloA/Tae2 family protein
MKFRELILSSGKLALAGKDAESNEELIKQVGKNEIVLHTEKPGSPFVNIKANAEETTKKDIKEAAIFCARYSQAWKKAKVKSDVEVHIFFGKDIFKLKDMKQGTFGVKKFKKIIVKKEDIEK